MTDTPRNTNDHAVEALPGLIAPIGLSVSDVGAAMAAQPAPIFPSQTPIANTMPPPMIT